MQLTIKTEGTCGRFIGCSRIGEKSPSISSPATRNQIKLVQPY